MLSGGKKYQKPKKTKFHKNHESDDYRNLRQQKQYITFVTIGTGNGRYLDVITDRAVSFHEQPILWGVGKLGYKNNSEYVTVNKHKRFKLRDLLNADR